MKFICEEPLLEYMRQKNCTCILVEVVTSDSSDFEVTELHLQLANDKKRRFFLEQKHYTCHATTWGSVLLPPYRLDYEEVVTFSLKKIWFLHLLRQEGISL